MPREQGTSGDSGPSEVLFMYGLCIMIVGALAFSEANMSNAALTSIFVSNGAAVLVFACAAAVRPHGRVRKGEPKYWEYMIGIHFAVLLPLAYAVACGFRAYKALQVPEKHYVAKYMFCNIVASLVTFFLMMRYRKAKPEAVSESAPVDTAAKQPPASKKGTSKKNGAEAAKAKAN